MIRSCRRGGVGFDFGAADLSFSHRTTATAPAPATGTATAPVTTQSTVIVARTTNRRAVWFRLSSVGARTSVSSSLFRNLSGACEAHRPLHQLARQNFSPAGTAQDITTHTASTGV